jgi:hypothetical protein
MNKLSLTFAIIFTLVLTIGAQAHTIQIPPTPEGEPFDDLWKTDVYQPGYVYEVTITNVTSGQLITPPLLFSHSANFELFTLGAPASEELAALAEGGDFVPLMQLLNRTPEFYDYAISSEPILPGESITLDVVANGEFRYFTVAGMLATTNDAFFAVHGAAFPRSTETLKIDGIAYDAGSEVNNESCIHIPGPPCEAFGTLTIVDPEEGFVHIHSGIHGNEDVDAQFYDWHNPVAIVTVQRVLQPFEDIDEEGE